MSNVIRVVFPTPASRRAGALKPLIRGFAAKRRANTDVMWLKENGELLNILESTGADVPPEDLAAYEEYYAEIERRLSFFPQYYRFILSLALDLEALGLPGNKAEYMCDWIVSQDLEGGETSDIQRLEARRLLARRGRAPIEHDSGVEDRLRRFCARPERFALPNKKAAYELTHIIFYLSEYGRKDPKISRSMLKSLENAGIWAFLDGNLDLLAEICISMRYAGHNPSGIWEDWIAQKMISSQVFMGHQPRPKDSYHAVFMGRWLGALKGGDGLSALSVGGDGQVPSVNMPAVGGDALREMSRHLFSLDVKHRADWTGVRGQLHDLLSPEANTQIAAAEDAADDFEGFFESFARTAQVVQA